MIVVKLFGGARRSFASNRLELEGMEMPLSELLDLLKNLVPKDRPVLDTGNVLVAVNGMDSSALDGVETVLRDGDVISIIPVVHGGGRDWAFFRISRYHVGLIRMGRGETVRKDLLENMRFKYRNLVIQGVSAKYILGVRHARRVIGVSLEANRSGTLLSNRIETDILMRFAATRQISEAINQAGLQKDSDSILIVIGKKSLVEKLYTEINGAVKPLEPLPKNAGFLKKAFKITRKEIDSVLSTSPLEDLLVERSTVLFH